MLRAPRVETCSMGFVNIDRNWELANYTRICLPSFVNINHSVRKRFAVALRWRLLRVRIWLILLNVYLLSNFLTFFPKYYQRFKEFPGYVTAGLPTTQKLQLTSAEQIHVQACVITKTNQEIMYKKVLNLRFFEIL